MRFALAAGSALLLMVAAFVLYAHGNVSTALACLLVAVAVALLAEDPA